MKAFLILLPLVASQTVTVVNVTSSTNGEVEVPSLGFIPHSVFRELVNGTTLPQQTWSEFLNESNHDEYDTYRLDGSRILADNNKLRSLTFWGLTQRVSYLFSVVSCDSFVISSSLVSCNFSTLKIGESGFCNCSENDELIKAECKKNGRVTLEKQCSPSDPIVLPIEIKSYRFKQNEFFLDSNIDSRLSGRKCLSDNYKSELVVDGGLVGIRYNCTESKHIRCVLNDLGLDLQVRISCYGCGIDLQFIGPVHLAVSEVAWNPDNKTGLFCISDGETTPVSRGPTGTLLFDTEETTTTTETSTLLATSSLGSSSSPVSGSLPDANTTVNGTENNGTLHELPSQPPTNQTLSVNLTCVELPVGSYFPLPEFENSTVCNCTRKGLEATAEVTLSVEVCPDDFVPLNSGGLTALQTGAIIGGSAGTLALGTVGLAVMRKSQFAMKQLGRMSWN